MDDPKYPSLQGWNQPQGLGNQMYPGLVDPFAAPSVPANPTVLPSQGSSKSAGLMNSLADWKLMLDRVGGLDGVMNTMGKLQKIFSSMQQMAPLLRLLIGKSKGASATAASVRNRSPRRRKRRHTGARRSTKRSNKRR